MATKRKVEEFDVCDIKESGSAIVHGVVTELSSASALSFSCFSITYRSTIHSFIEL